MLAPQGLEYVDPGESIQEALNRAKMVVLTQGQHSAVDGLSMRADQWLCGMGSASRLFLGSRITVAEGQDTDLTNGVISDLYIRGPTGTNTDIIKLNDVDGFLIRDLEIDGHVADNPFGPSDNGQIGIHLNESSNIRISGLKAHDFGKDCVYAAGCTDVLVRDSHFKNFSRGGVTTVDVDGLDVSGCLFEDGYDLSVVIGNNGVWIEPDNAQAVFNRVTIRNNTFRNLNRGVLFYNTQGVANSVQERDNIFEVCRYGGVLYYVADAPRSTHSFFDRCALETDDPIGLENCTAAVSVFNSPGAVVYHHEFSACGGDLATVMLGPNCRRASVRKCTFNDDQKRAIYVYYVFGGNTFRDVRDNTCSDGSQASVGTLPAIEIAGTASHPVDADLVIDNTGDLSTYSAVVKTTYVDNGRFSPNYCTGSGGVGQDVVNAAPGLVFWEDADYTATVSDLTIVSKPQTNVARSLVLASGPFPGQRVVVKDGKGDAATRNITITPASGTIDGASSFVIDSNYGAAEFLRGQTEWHIVSER